MTNFEKMKEVLTRKELFTFLEQTEANYGKVNAYEMLNKTEEGLSAENILKRAFSWQDTPQEVEYWLKISKRIS